MATNNTDEIEEIEKKDQEVAQLEEYPPELLIKHPLQNTWTFWYYTNDRQKVWEECQREISSFDTVEDFWALYNHIILASELRSGCDYSMFKKGIRPMWEDDANKEGGRWLMQLDKRHRNSELDRLWLEMLLCMIGEAFDDYSDDVCGAVVNVRPKGDKLAAWTTDASKSQSVLEIGKKLKERMGLQQRQTIGYQVHKDTIVKAGSSTKNTYQV